MKQGLLTYGFGKGGVGKLGGAEGSELEANVFWSSKIFYGKF